MTATGNEAVTLSQLKTALEQTSGGGDSLTFAQLSTEDGSIFNLGGWQVQMPTYNTPSLIVNCAYSAEMFVLLSVHVESWIGTTSAAANLTITGPSALKPYGDAVAMFNYLISGVEYASKGIRCIFTGTGMTLALGPYSLNKAFAPLGIIAQLA